MNQPAKRYRVACRCAAEVAVGPGQAGGRIACPTCGGMIEVPRLRELEAAGPADSVAPLRRWRPCQGWLLAGAITAVTAAAAALFVGRWNAAVPPRLPESAAIRAAINAADAATIHKAWQAIRSSSVDRGALPEELRMQKAAGMARRVGGMLWGVAGLGGVVAAAAGIACLFALNRRGGSPAGAPP